ncbi:MAG: hypothetical protein M1815_003992 [Lichina confinis]|nr:MAG: hypothetical protein M1815_003992 [Lichina confinis]
MCRLLRVTWGLGILSAALCSPLAGVDEASSAGSKSLRDSSGHKVGHVSSQGRESRFDLRWAGAVLLKRSDRPTDPAPDNDDPKHGEGASPDTPQQQASVSPVHSSPLFRRGHVPDLTNEALSLVFPPDVVEEFERLRKAHAENERIRVGSKTTNDDGTPLTPEQREQIRRDSAAYKPQRRRLIKALIASNQASEELIKQEAVNLRARAARSRQVGKQRSATEKIELARWTELRKRVLAGTATPEEVSEWQELDTKREKRLHTKRLSYASVKQKHREERRRVLDLRAKYGTASVEELQELKQLRRILGSVEGEPQFDDPGNPRSSLARMPSRRNELKLRVKSGAANAQELQEWAELEQKRQDARRDRLSRKAEEGQATAKELEELEVLDLLHKKRVDEELAAAEAQQQRDAQEARRDELLDRIAAKRATLAEQAEFDELERLLHPIEDDDGGGGGGGDVTASTGKNEFRLGAMEGGPSQAPLRSVRTGGDPRLRRWQPDAIGDAFASLPQRMYKGIIDLRTNIGNAFSGGGGYGSLRPGAPALRPLGV